MLVSKAPSTQLEYRREVRSLLDLGPLRELTLQALVRWMKDGPRTLSVAARNRRVAAAQSLLTFGHRTGYLAANVGSAIRLKAAPRPLH